MIDTNKLDELDLSLDGQQKVAAQMIESARVSIEPYITALARDWDTNIKFYEGNQWIYYNETSGRNEIIPIIQDLNDYIPRPVTNYIANKVYTIASLFTKNKPAGLVFPNSDDEADEMAAKLAESLLDTKYEIDQEQIKLIEAVIICLTCGTVFRKDFWNPSLRAVESREGGYNKRYIGDSDVKMMTPFEVKPDIVGGTFFFEESVVPIETIRKMFDVEADGYTGLIDQVKPNRYYSGSLQLREQLRTLTRSTLHGFSTNTTNADYKNTAVLVEAYIMPTRRYPHGLMIVECGGVPLYVNHSPYYNPKIEDSWHPYSVWKWRVSPTRWHGIPLVSDAVPLQRRINGIDSIIQLNNMTNVSPVWLNPKSCGVPAGFYGGRPGLVVNYNDSPNGPSPSRLPGIPLGADIHRERMQKVQDLGVIFGDNEVMSGKNPTGVNTATGLQLLMEQTTGKFSPQYISFEKFVESGSQKKLNIIQKFYVENDPNFLRTLKRYGKNSYSVNIEAFVGSDLRDNVSVRIESGSSIPRSKLVEQQQLLDLAKLGLFGDISPANPVANQEFLSKFGIVDFDGVVNPDLRKAKFVVSVLNQVNAGRLSVENIPPLMPFDNVDIHMGVLEDEMKKPEFDDKLGVFKLRFDELNEFKEAQIMVMQSAGDPAMMGQESVPLENPDVMTTGDFDQQNLNAQALPIDQMPPSGV